MKSRSVAPAIWLLAASLVGLLAAIAFVPRVAGPFTAYAIGTFIEPVSIVAALAIGVLVRPTWLTLAVAAVAAVAIHFVVLSIDPDVVNLRRVNNEPVSDTFVMLSRAWGLLVAVAIVHLVTRWVRGAGSPKVEPAPETPPTP